MDRRETEQWLDAVRQARAAREPAALATIVRVRGSAYRREGTRMFIRRDGTYECALSGGCLEPAVAEAAVRVIATGEPALISYDLADESIWGLGIGCTGAVDILIERLADDPLTNTWLRVLERAEAAVMVTPLSGASGRLIVPAVGEAVGSLSDARLQQEAIGRARRRLAGVHPTSGPERLDSAELFFEVALPPPSLLIFGAGHDAPPVATLAWSLGFDVTIVDVREAFLSPDRFPHATLVRAHFSQFMEKVRSRRGSFIVIMNHQAERDRESLRFGLAAEAAYIGVLGPRARYDKLLAELAAAGVSPDPASLARVRSPVGLALGAETPQEVAVSILSEILAIRRGFEGGFLHRSAGSLHRPEDRRLLARS